ncbi:MAG TPA: GGDEF domain-containing protein [Burkholderiales bacterium]|nr:GGDEF domain-containing protein [Burkholderiales bacterium]
MFLQNLRLYQFMNHLGILRRSYLLKFLLVVFLGTYVPLIILVLYLALSRSYNLIEMLPIVIAALLVIIIGTVITLLFLEGLLTPVRQTSDSLKKYLAERSLPDLPTVYGDEAGQLMADAQYVITRLDNTLRELENISLTDHLTGMYNRRAGEHRLEEEIARAERENKKFLLAFIDLNLLKQINDQYGHDAGDACLIHFASLLAECVRRGDWCARWGGDEFVLAVYQADAGADLVFNRVLTELESKPCLVRQNVTLYLSVSIGVAVYQRGMAVEKLVQQADQAMYQAKLQGSGKSKVVFYGK